MGTNSRLRKIRVMINPFRTPFRTGKGHPQVKKKIETTNKASLKLPSRINLERRGAPVCRALDLGHSPYAPPTVWKGLKALH